MLVGSALYVLKSCDSIAITNCSLDQALFAAKLEFPETLVLRIRQNASNVNNGCAGKSFDNALGTLMFYFIALILVFFR